MANVFDQFDEPEGITAGKFLSSTLESLFAGTEPAIGTLEAGTQFVTGATALPISGLAGIIAAIPDGRAPAEAVEEVQRTLTFQPRTETGQAISAGLGGIVETGAKAVRAPFAGLAAAVQPSPEAARETFGRVLEEGIGPTAGGAVLEAGGGPLLATGVRIIPEAIATILGTKGLKPRPEVPRIEAPRAAAPRLTPTEPAVSVGRPGLDVPVDFTPPISPESIVASLKKGKPKAVAEAVFPDKQIIESAQRLGVDLNPEHYSTNVAFQDVARALKSKPGSKLEAAERVATQRLSTVADDLVEEIGGSIDKASVSESIRSQVVNSIDDLQTQANIAYDKVKQSIPAQTRVEPGLMREFIDQKIADFGGDVSLLSSAEKKLLNMLKRKEPPTYAALDRLRRDVGDGFNKRRGPFADESDGNLRQIYGVLSEAQNGIAASFGVGDLYAGARQLIVKRKGIEDSAVQLFGRNLSNSLVPQIRSTAVALSKGDVSRLNRLLEALPENRRVEVSATILGELFATGSRRGGALGQGFVSTFQSLNRNKAAKAALFENLPAASRKRFDDIGRVFSGIIKANQKPLSNPSGTAAGIIRSLDDASALSRIYDVGKRAAVAEGISTAVGIPGAGTAGTIGAVLAKGRTPVSVAADEMIASVAFKDAIQESITGTAAKADQIIQNSPQFKKWVGTVDQATAREIGTLGFISWLISEENQ